MMIRSTLIAPAAAVLCAALSACSPAVPESGYQGVGFDDYAEYERARAAREAELAGSALPAADAISSEPLSALRPGLGPETGTAADTGSGTEAETLAAEAQAMLERTRANSGERPVDADPSNPAPGTVETSTGISAENNFEAVGSRRSIEDDAALMARNQAQYEVIEPTALPSREGASGPNIVSFALATNHAPGTQVYRRSSFGTQARTERNCARYASADQAQLDFLERGGPERDRLRLDPDGDGFACGWDPSPFRAAVSQSGGG